MSRANRPRILYVITDLNTGGVPLHLLRLATRVQDRGFDVHVVSLAPPGPVSDALQRAGVSTDSCEAHGPWHLAAVDRLAGTIRDHRPDLVHALLFHANLATRVAAVLSGFPTQRIICEIQTVEVERRWHLRVDRWTHRWCRLVVGNSPSVVDHLALAGRLPRSRLRLMWGGIDTRALCQAQPLDRHSLGLGDGEALLLWVGRLDVVKGLDDLVNAVGMLPAALRVQLVLVGDGSYRGALERKILLSGIADRVRLLGMREDVPRLLRAADVFVFPSWTEGLPNALLEAMAVGLPVVTTDVAGCRDVVTDGVNGLLVPPRRPAALAGAVQRLLSNRELAKRLGTAASALVTQRFTADRCADRFVELYRVVLVQAAPPFRDADEV